MKHLTIKHFHLKTHLESHRNAADQTNHCNRHEKILTTAMNGAGTFTSSLADAFKTTARFD